MRDLSAQMQVETRDWTPSWMGEEWIDIEIELMKMQPDYFVSVGFATWNLPHLRPLRANALHRNGFTHVIGLFPSLVAAPDKCLAKSHVAALVFAKYGGCHQCSHSRRVLRVVL
jgi:hypothetical protein